MSIESEPADGLGWGFGSFLFQGAFAELSKGLRWMFWGLVLQVIGWTSLLAGFGLALHGLVGIPLRIMILGGGITMLAGSLGLIWGEQKCLHLELPLGMTHALPGRRSLQVAYWCHMGGILARLFR